MDERLIRRQEGNREKELEGMLGYSKEKEKGKPREEENISQFNTFLKNEGWFLQTRSLHPVQSISALSPDY